MAGCVHAGGFSAPVATPGGGAAETAGQALCRNERTGKGRRWRELTTALCASIMAVSLALAAASLPVDVMPASMWHGETGMLPVAAAARADDLSLARAGSAGYTAQPALHSPAEIPLHPSTLTLSGYPAVGGGAAELVFTVTYAGDMRQGGGAALGQTEPPVVRLDITGTGHRDLYRITNITSNIGAVAPDTFEPYNYETETVRAELGATYTVRAMIEFVTEGFIPVYAFGFDGDVVTVNVAASESVSMSYSEYVATRQDYLDSATDSLADVHAPPGAPVPIKGRIADPLASHPFSPSPIDFSRPLAEPAMQRVFNATGTVMGDDATGELVPVHGIRVCVYDRPSAPNYTRLNTTAGDPACGYTDTSGKYKVLNVNGADPDDMTYADVFVSVESLGYGGAIEVVKYLGYGVLDVYYVDSDEEKDYNGTDLVKNFNLRDDDPGDRGMAGAARIISAISDGMKFFEAHGQNPADLMVKWNYTGGSSVFPNNNVDGAFYRPAEATIYLNGYSDVAYNATHVRVLTEDDSRERHTILHEYGHHVQDTHHTEFEVSCIPHYIHKKYDEACAWSEGWANLVPHLVDDSADLPIGIDGTMINIEKGRVTLPNDTPITFNIFEESGRPVGEKVEGSVAAAMWDIADNEVDDNHDVTMPGLPNRPVGHDNVSAGVDALLDVFFADPYDSFADFYDRWEIDMRHDSAEDIAILHGMSFAIPSNTSYYGFAGELGGVFKYGTSSLLLRPNYVDVSGNGSIVAATSERGRALQMVDARTGEHMGLYATQGYDQACTLEEYPLTCLDDIAASTATDLGPAGFSSMDGIEFGLNSSVVLVSDGYQDRVQIIGTGGGYLGKFGAPGNGSGEFSVPDGITFLPDDKTAAVADTANSRIQTFGIAGNGSAQYASQFQSYDITYYTLPIIRQQLATGPNGTLYAAGLEFPGIWMYPAPHGTSNATLIDDPSLRRLGGIDVDQNGLVYVSDVDQGRIRVYDPNGMHGDVTDSQSQIGERSLSVREVQGGTGIGTSVGAEAFIDEFGSRGPYAWQLGTPLGIALGPPDAHTGDVRVYVADRNGIKMYEKDREKPRVESVWAHTPDGIVNPGETVELAVNFSERVTVVGTPVLNLGAGVAKTNATYVSGSGSRTLTFNYTVAAEAASSYIGYAGMGSLSLLPGSATAPAIADGSGNLAILTLPENGTAESLASNAALWINTSQAGAAPFRIAAQATVGAVEHREVRFNVTTANGSMPASPGSYSMTGEPGGATISPNGIFAWTPGEAHDGLHAFVVSASEQGNSSVSHARTFRVLVAEENVAPVVTSVPDKRAFVLSELRFNIVATDSDLPAQPLQYLLASDLPTFATVLPNGTFVWTPSVYDIGTTVFNVSIADGFDNGNEEDITPSVEFSVTVSLGPTPTPVSVYALTPSGSAAEHDDAYMANQTVRIGVNFSEAVRVQAGSDGSTPYLGLSTGSDGARAPYDAGNNTETLVFAYTVRDADATSRLSYAGTNALALNGGTIVSSETGEPASVVLPDPASQAPLGRIVGATTGGENMTMPSSNVTLVVGSSGVGASEDLGDRGDEARVTLDVGRITTSGGSATFPQAGVAINTSFAHVTFPPGAVATSVPADRVLVLYIADDLPDNSTVQRLLGYAGSGNVTLQRVVEIGDEDGRIEFNMPVRISLDGQAGGRAFYIAGAGGTITPIDDACAADDATRVHRQLGGSGECQIDAGGDKVVYTYHLTRYGTAAPETGAAPPVDHSCSVRIASDDLPVRVRPGATSTAAPQAVTNAGSLQFERVALNATAWTTNLGERLSAAFTEVSEVGENRGYKRVAEAGATPVAEGLGGGEERQVWFKLNLAGHTEVSGTTITQSIEYLAECRAPPGQ